MKAKIISLIAVFALIVSAMGTTVFAEGTPTLSVGTEYKLTELVTDFEFTPSESDFYFIYSVGEESMYGYIQNNETLDFLQYDYRTGLGENFRLSVYLEAGVSYTVHVQIYENPKEFDVSVIVEHAVPEGSITENAVHTVEDNWDYLTFVPSKTATYRFFSVEEETYEEGYWGNIYNSDFELISVQNDSLYSDNNFYVEADLTAGETYYLDTYYTYDAYNTDFVPYGVKIAEISPITSLEIVPLDGTVVPAGGGDLHCELIIGPENHKSQEIEWYIEPERVGRIEYGGDWGASIELNSPGTAEVTAITYNNGKSVRDSYIVTCEGELPQLETGVTVTDSMYDYEERSYHFTAEKEGWYGILSRGDLDLQCTLYVDGEWQEMKTEGKKGAGDNFNLQFYNLEPGTKYIVEVRFENPDIYDTQYGEFEVMAYETTDELEGIQMSVGSEHTVYAGTAYGEVTYEQFSVSLLPETVKQDALEWVVWDMEGDDIGYEGIYGRNFYGYYFDESGTATLTARVAETFTDKDISVSSTITCVVPNYKEIHLDEVKTVRTDGHYSEGWFCFVPEEDGEYTFYSTGSADAYMSVDGETFDDDSGYNYNYLYTAELTAGYEYYFEAWVYDGEDAEEFSVSVCKAYYADSITIVPDESNVYEVGESAAFYAMMGNGGATYYDQDLLMWSIIDNGVAYISGGYGDSLYLEFVGEGEVIIDVVTAEGYHATYTVYVGVDAPAEPPEEEVIPGDVDGDGNVSAEDSYYIRIFIVDFIISGEYEESADLNGDGKITAVDSLLLRKMIAGIL